MFRVFSFLYFLLIVPQLCQAQSIIQLLEMDDFPQYQIRYPYERLDIDGRNIFLTHKPVVRINEFDFVAVWNPKGGSERNRVLVKFDLLLDEAWRAEFKLEWEEVIEHIYQNDDEIIVITTDFDRNLEQHRAIARRFDLENGELTEKSFIFINNERLQNNMFVAISPDEDHFAIYYYRNSTGKRDVSTYFDHIRTDEKLGHRVSKADVLPFAIYDRDLNQVAYDSLNVSDLNSRIKSYGLGCEIDNDANLYFMTYQTPNSLKITQFKSSNASTTQLVYDDFPNIWKKNDIYRTHLPPFLGQDNILYMAFSERQRIKARWHTMNYRVLAFDFDKGEINRDRFIESTSKIQVQAVKKRIEFGMPPLKNFDQYLIREIRQTPDGRIWLFTQKFYEDQLFGAYTNQMPIIRYEHKLEEILIHEFSPEGQYTRTMVVPTNQEVGTARMMSGEFYSCNFSAQDSCFQFITHEMDGETLTRPPRTYYRKLNIYTGEVSPRKQLVDGRQTYQFYLKPYTVWLKPDIVALMVDDGTDYETYYVTLNLSEEEADIELTRKRAKKVKPKDRRNEEN